VREVLTAAPFDRDQILRLAAGAEYGSTHPIARAIRECCADAPLPTELHEHAGRGVIATVDGVRVAVGNRLLLREQGIEVPQADAAGAVFVALDGVYAGQIKVGDEVRSEAMRAIEALRSVGIRKTVMLTGDSEVNARPITAALGIDDCYAGLLPEEKYRHLERLIRQGSGPVLFVGDGINDAPVLARADVGIAMGGIGSDAAIEAADAVILSDRLTRIPEAIRIARRTLRIATANIVFALGVKLSILILSAFGLNESMWLAVFADVGVAVIAILNAMRAMRVRHLRVEKTSGERNP
jgi:Cd2+/Zn2+-exporting ATPase